MTTIQLADAMKALNDVTESVSEMEAEIKLLRKERDEARRMYCSMVENNSRQYGTSAEVIATRIGWDCFKEEADANNNEFKKGRMK